MFWTEAPTHITIHQYGEERNTSLASLQTWSLMSTSSHRLAACSTTTMTLQMTEIARVISIPHEGWRSWHDFVEAVFLEDVDGPIQVYFHN